MKRAEKEALFLLDGINECTIEELKDIFVDPFDCARRSELFSRFFVFYTKLKRFNVPMELWVDGSFCSDAYMPKDIDIVLFADEAHLTALSQEQMNDFSALTDPDIAFHRYRVDLITISTFFHGAKDYYEFFFGTDREGIEKGFAKLFIHPKGGNQL